MYVCLTRIWVHLSSDILSPIYVIFYTKLLPDVLRTISYQRFYTTWFWPLKVVTLSWKPFSRLKHPLLIWHKTFQIGCLITIRVSNYIIFMYHFIIYFLYPKYCYSNQFPLYDGWSVYTIFSILMCSMHTILLDVLQFISDS